MEIKKISETTNQEGIGTPGFAIIPPHLSAVHDLDLEMYIAVRGHDSSAHFTYRFPI